ncbi:MAG: hypothetical protein J5772_06650 [Clostridia bacterium]|nr:hypothetical protein [Clostridia bacterium]
MKRSLRDSIAKKEPAEAGPERNNVGRSVNELMNEYSGMSENELMRELIAATSRQKAEGSFDSAALQKGVSTILPMLNEEQKRKLYDILGRI